MTFPNYGSYQMQFSRRVREVYAAEGLSFLDAVGKAFPPTERGPVSVDEAINRLEAIALGFVVWRRSLTALR